MAPSLNFHWSLEFWHLTYSVFRCQLKMVGDTYFLPVALFPCFSYHYHRLYVKGECASCCMLPIGMHIIPTCSSYLWFSLPLQRSPRWLLTKNSSSLEARIAIKKLRNLKDEKEVLFFFVNNSRSVSIYIVCNHQSLMAFIYTGVC